MDTEKEVVIQKGRINYGDLVILYEGGDSVKYFTLEKGKDFQNKFGRFKHDDMYNQYFGKRIYNTKNDINTEKDIVINKLESESDP